MVNETLYTAEYAGSGQFARCIRCKERPIKDGCEVYDGCLGKLSPDIVMNACCGHDEPDTAYVQFWDGSCIRGKEATRLQSKLKEKGRGKK